MKKLIFQNQFKDLEEIVVVCDCGDLDHILLITHDADPRDQEAGKSYYVTMKRTYEFSFWGRLKQFMRYLFYGPWCEEIVLSRESALELGKALVESVSKGLINGKEIGVNPENINR